MRQLPRIWRSPYSDFGHDLSDICDETVTADAVYTDDVLAGIAASGFDAIWVHGLLHHMTPSSVFAEFGPHAATHLSRLRALIERAARHGVRVYIYLQPPRGFDLRDPFWQAHPDVQGVHQPWLTLQGEPSTYAALCTSTAPVKEYLRESPRRLMEALPDLGGVILITASEYPSHCYARGYPYAHYVRQGRDPMPPLGCERCARRHPADVIGEIVHLVRDGIRDVSDEAEVIVWNWSWSSLEEDPSPGILGALPDDVVYMADFERGDSKEILGKVRPIDEYSLSFAGPSRRFVASGEVARKRGLRVMAKLQLGTTHELATVPNLPLIGSLHEKARRMREMGIDGFMGCWNFGNFLSANTAAFCRFVRQKPLPERDTALREFAQSYFPGCDPEQARLAWESFGAAMDSYPFSIPFIYYSPLNYTLSYPLSPGPLKGDPAGRSWVEDPRGDDLSACLDHPYTLDEVIRGLGRTARRWKIGARQLADALSTVEESAAARAREETANARVCYHVFRSGWNTFRAYRLRKRWSEDKLPAYRRIAADEIRNLEAVLPYIEADPRFGFHAEPHAYLFDAAGIREKLRGLREQVADKGVEIG